MYKLVFVFSQIQLLCSRPRTLWRGGCSSFRVQPQTARLWCGRSAGTGRNTWSALTGQVWEQKHLIAVFVCCHSYFDGIARYPRQWPRVYVEPIRHKCGGITVKAQPEPLARPSGSNDNVLPVKLKNIINHVFLFRPHRELQRQSNRRKGGREEKPRFHLSSLLDDPQQHTGPWGRGLPSPEPPKPS